MACIYRNEPRIRCTEPKIIRKRINKLICSKTSDRIKKNELIPDTFYLLHFNFDLLFRDRGDNVNHDNCPSNRKCGYC
jgi:hypothetical protein